MDKDAFLTLSQAQHEVTRERSREVETQTQTHTDTHRHTDTQTHTDTHTHTHTQTQTHRHAHTHTHTHTHTDTHTPKTWLIGICLRVSNSFLNLIQPSNPTTQQVYAQLTRGKEAPAVEATVTAADLKRLCVD